MNNFRGFTCQNHSVIILQAVVGGARLLPPRVLGTRTIAKCKGGLAFHTHRDATSMIGNRTQGCIRPLQNTHLNFLPPSSPPAERKFYSWPITSWPQLVHINPHKLFNGTTYPGFFFFFCHCLHLHGWVSTKTCRSWTSCRARGGDLIFGLCLYRKLFEMLPALSAT